MRGDERQTNRDHNSSGEVVVALMGLTGAGKSTFIKTVTGNPKLRVGHGLDSETSKVASYTFHDGRTKYILIDTPGFDDSRLSNEDVAQKILKWLESSYRSGTKLNGIIYLHNITKPRMQGSAFKNLRMFRSLCGGDGLQNVILATTFWDQVEPSYGEKREQELITSKQFWADMVAKGSKVMRLQRNKATCLAVLREIAKNQKMQLDTAATVTQDNETAKVEAELRKAKEREIKRMRGLAKKQARKAKREKMALRVEAGWKKFQSASRRCFNSTYYVCKVGATETIQTVRKWRLEYKTEKQRKKLRNMPYYY